MPDGVSSTLVCVWGVVLIVRVPGSNGLCILMEAPGWELHPGAYQGVLRPYLSHLKLLIAFVVLSPFYSCGTDAPEDDGTYPGSHS